MRMIHHQELELQPQPQPLPQLEVCMPHPQLLYICLHLVSRFVSYYVKEGKVVPAAGEKDKLPQEKIFLREFAGKYLIIGPI